MMLDGAALIAAERRRQLELGFTADLDDEHDDDQLALAAACYATPPLSRLMHLSATSLSPPRLWPWNEAQWNPDPRSRLHDLVRAGALIAAEIDRLLRAETRA